MDSKAKRIFIACALGTMAGILLSTLVPGIIWWLGALAGGATAGLVWSWREVAYYTPIAARLAWQEMAYLPRIYASFARRTKNFGHMPTYKKWQAMPVVMFFCILIITLGAAFQGWLDGKQIEFAIYYIMVAGLLALVSSVGLTADNEKDKTNHAKVTVAFQTPPGVMIFMLGVALLMLALATTELYKFFRGFFKRLGRFIYSRELVICFVSGAVGVLISYPLFVVWLDMELGPALASGGLLGGLLGLLQYEFISKRWLHLAPSN